MRFANTRITKLSSASCLRGETRLLHATVPAKTEPGPVPRVPSQAQGLRRSGSDRHRRPTTPTRRGNKFHHTFGARATGGSTKLGLGEPDPRAQPPPTDLKTRPDPNFLGKLPVSEAREVDPSAPGASHRAPLPRPREGRAPPRSHQWAQLQKKFNAFPLCTPDIEEPGKRGVGKGPARDAPGQVGADRADELPSTGQCGLIRPDSQ